MWNICGLEFKPGEKKQISLELGACGYYAPVTFLCGARPGMTLLITAGIHSGEYPGIPATIRAVREIDPQKLVGNMIVMHSVNISGFWAKSPGRIPEDGVNLNGDYPGKKDGTTGQQVADYFVRELFPKVEFILDLHSGGPTEPLTPCLFFPKAEKVRSEALEAAKALDIPYLIESTATKGEYSYAANYFDVPGLLLERGYCGYCLEEWIQAYYKDIFLFLNHKGMYKTAVRKKIQQQKIYTKTIYLCASEQGLWYPAVRQNDSVKKGALLGHVEDFSGNVITKYFAEEDGTVFYYTSGLAVNPGDPLAAYGLESSISEG